MEESQCGCDLDTCGHRCVYGYWGCVLESGRKRLVGIYSKVLPRCENGQIIFQFSFFLDIAPLYEAKSDLELTLPQVGLNS